MSSDEQELSPPKAEEKKANVFKNDGSFLELFKKMQDSAKKEEQPSKKPDEPAATLSELEEAAAKPPPVPVGKRRGGRVLPTGQVKKQKPEADSALSGSTGPAKDAWSAYMAEVKKYQNSTCEEEGKNRPLVK